MKLSWCLKLGVAGLLALPLFGPTMWLVDSQRAPGHVGWFHWLPPFLHFLHPPFFHSQFYVVSAVLGVFGAIAGRVVDVIPNIADKTSGDD